MKKRFRSGKIEHYPETVFVTIAARIMMIARSVTKVEWGSCKGLTLSTNIEMFSLRED